MCLIRKGEGGGTSFHQVEDLKFDGSGLAMGPSYGMRRMRPSSGRM